MEDDESHIKTAAPSNPKQRRIVDHVQSVKQFICSRSRPKNGYCLDKNGGRIEQSPARETIASYGISEHHGTGSCAKKFKHSEPNRVP